MGLGGHGGARLRQMLLTSILAAAIVSTTALVGGCTGKAAEGEAIPDSAPVDPRHALGSWDLDENGELSRQEFEVTLFRMWDRNRDGVVSEVEWLEGVDSWWPIEPYGESWSTWDLDADSDLDANEFSRGLAEDRLYALIDRDGSGAVERHELGSWLGELSD